MFDCKAARIAEFDLVERGAVALGGAGDGFGLVHADVLELIAERLPDAHALAGEPNAEAADLLVPVRVVAGQPGGCRDAVGHAVDAQLRPALAPQIGRRLDAVDRADHVRELLDSLGDAAVQFAGAVDLVRRGALRAGAAHPARGIELGAEQGGDDADRLVRADDPGDAFLVDAVLQRHDVAVGRQVLGDQHRRPFRVIGLDRNHRDVDRFMLCEILDLGQMHRLRFGADIFLFGYAFDRQTVAADRLDMLGPGVDQRDVEPVMCEMTAGIAADCAGTDHRNTLVHDLVLP